LAAGHPDPWDFGSQVCGPGQKRQVGETRRWEIKPSHEIL